MEREITCVVPDGHDPHNRVDRVGGPWGSRCEDFVIEDIEGGVHQYIVEVDGELVDVVVAKRHGLKYLRTDPDKTTSNNLLSLPRCP